MQHIIKDCPEVQDIRNSLSIPDKLEEDLSTKNSTQILSFLMKINIVNNL